MQASSDQGLHPTVTFPEPLYRVDGSPNGRLDCDNSVRVHPFPNRHVRHEKLLGI
jgi:hypothetical protein